MSRPPFSVPKKQAIPEPPQGRICYLQSCFLAQDANRDYASGTDKKSIDERLDFDIKV